jgi:hypothetical protein
MLQSAVALVQMRSGLFFKLWRVRLKTMPESRKNLRRVSTDTDTPCFSCSLTRICSALSGLVLTTLRFEPDSLRSVYWDGLSDDLLESIQTDVAPNVGVVALWFLGYAL